MAFALVVMAVVVGALVVRLIHKNNELKEKNDVIVREVLRNQTLIDRAVQQGVSRAAMLSFFGKSVKEHLGMSPTQYRQQNLKIGNRNLKLETKKMQASLACIFLICWMNISALLHIPKFPVASHFNFPTAGNPLLL